MQLQDKSLWRSQCLIDGRWIDADGGQHIAVTNPADGSTLGHVPRMGTEDTRRAISAAERALPAWRAKTAAERSSLLKAWHGLILAHTEDLAVIMTSEQGKPLAEARAELANAAAYVEWFAEEAKRAYGEIIPAPRPKQQVVVTKEPVGVCAAITPWNFPSAMLARKAAPALAAGCTLVAKPASQTPYSALALAELALRAGIPAGVLNVITGSASAIGEELTSNPVVRKLSFTGSTEIGRILMAQCAGTIKRVSLELGGNAPFIVFDDADLDAAVEGAMVSKYRNAGQTCVCANRFYVQDGIYDAFVKRLAQKVAGHSVGPGLQEGSTQGPLIDEDAVHKVQGHIDDAVGKGARVVTGGKRHALGGTFFEPTVLADVTPDMRVSSEETFGPLAPVFRFTDEAEGVRLANDTEYGLAAYFYTRDMARAWRVGGALEYGMVGINTGLVTTEVAPFGGIKSSGIGREGSRHGLDEYLELKYLCMAGL
ncbi:MAG TPA: NAD-dependent succinate-semialdehyde dehydrogenase [Thioalkalivibrio sp.]|nr:NAD-dependent succinate-semialdehyde dehydrogenase [Thioalkalivibrio sp.]